MLTAVAENIQEYIHGKKWYWYVPLLFLNLWVFVAVLGFHPNEQAALVIMPMTALDFGLHEFAHIAAAFLPAVLTAAAGSGSELLLGSLLIFGAFKTKCYFAAVFCSLWFMLACQSAGIYMADARAQNLELVSLGGALSGSDQVIHDWNFVFGKLHLLPLDTFIGGTVRAVGIIVGLAGLGFGVWLMIQMAHHADDKPVLNEREHNLLGQTRVDSPLRAADPFAPTPLADKPRSLYPEVSRGPLATHDQPANDDSSKRAA